MKDRIFRTQESAENEYIKIRNNRQTKSVYIISKGDKFIITQTKPSDKSNMIIGYERDLLIGTFSI
jgi:hypothetical protein